MALCTMTTTSNVSTARNETRFYGILETNHLSLLVRLLKPTDFTVPNKKEMVGYRVLVGKAEPYRGFAAPPPPPRSYAHTERADLLKGLKTVDKHQMHMFFSYRGSTDMNAFSSTQRLHLDSVVGDACGATNTELVRLLTGGRHDAYEKLQQSPTSFLSRAASSTLIASHYLQSWG
ncbi:hypothetical protein LTR37_019993 [Vermiconidia calcicola]|uniref:Uncharacterized protein n=1 Tax=Vermiconidia calcicola TaxID=1690605 RepID=A0ACC3MEK2_9PEZI|nr:hypothetical protein LTR37_019993 [Vermiconidia calcicola]